MSNPTENYDYVIVGSGFGGSVSALRLAEKGYRVLVLEKGKWFTKDDFPKTNWNLNQWLWLPAMRFFGIFKITVFRNATVLSGTGVGGGSLVYANTLPRPQEAFYTHGNWAGLANWKEELALHYTEAERMLGAAENPRYFDADNVLLEVARTYDNEEAVSPTNISVFFGEPEQVVPDPFFNGEGPEREGCSFCGGCMTGCRHNAKNSLDKNYLYLAQKKGATVEAERLVTKVVPAGNEDGSDGYRVTHLSQTAFGKGKSRKTIEAKGVIFSGGVLGTMSLLMDMKHKKHLPNLSDAVGDHVRTNNENLCYVVAKKSDKDYSKGIAIGAIFAPNSDGHVEVVRYREGSGFWKVGILPMVFSKNTFIRLPKLLLKTILQPWNVLRLYLTGGFARQSFILLFMQHLDSTLKLKS